MNLHKNTIALTILCTALLGAFAARTHAQDCKAVHATVSGVSIDDRSFDGFATGGISGRARTRMGEIRMSLGGFGLLEARSSYETTRGTLRTRDLIMLFPGPDKDTLIWAGEHEVLGGTRDFDGAKGFLKSAGVIERSSGLVKYELMGRVCFPDDAPSRGRSIARPKNPSKKPKAKYERDRKTIDGRPPKKGKK